MRLKLGSTEKRLIPLYKFSIGFNTHIHYNATVRIIKQLLIYFLFKESNIQGLNKLGDHTFTLLLFYSISLWEEISYGTQQESILGPLILTFRG